MNESRSVPEPGFITSEVAEWLPELLEPPTAPQFGETRLGRLVAVADGIPLVEFPGNPLRSPVAARSTVPVTADRTGTEVVLAFPGGDPRCPVILGVVLPSAVAAPPRVEGDGERVTLSAEREVVLRCGEASITLTRAGKIIIRGAYVLSRSTGVNQVKGGSVQIN
jgi:hypothetical protein